MSDAQVGVTQKLLSVADDAVSDAVTPAACCPESDPRTLGLGS